MENMLERSSKMQLRDGSLVALDDNARYHVLQALNEMSTNALRCLGFAYKDELPMFEDYNGSEDHPAHKLLLNPSNYSSIENELTFVGLVGLRVSFDALLFAVYDYLLHQSLFDLVNLDIGLYFARTLLGKRYARQLRTAQQLGFKLW